MLLSSIVSYISMLLNNNDNKRKTQREKNRTTAAAAEREPHILAVNTGYALFARH